MILCSSNLAGWCRYSRVARVVAVDAIGRVPGTKPMQLEQQHILSRRRRRRPDQQQHKQYKQHRFISTTYLSDLIFQRPNPLLKILEKSFKSNTKNAPATNLLTFVISNANNNNNDDDDFENQIAKHNVSVDMDRIPNLSPDSSNLEPFHAKAATLKILQDYQHDLETLASQYCSNYDDNDNNKSTTSQYNTNVNFWMDWNRINEPIMALDRILSLLSQVSEVSKKAEWKRAQDLWTEKRRAIEGNHAAWIHSLVLSTLQNPHQTSTPTTTAHLDPVADWTTLSEQQIEWAAHCLRLYLEEHFSPHLVGISSDHDENGDDLYEKDQALHRAIQDTTQQFLQYCQLKDKNMTKSTIGLMYNLIGLSGDRAKLCGFTDVTTKIMKERRRMATRDNVDQLYRLVTEHCLSFLQPNNSTDGYDDGLGRDEFAILEGFLQKSGNPVGTKSNKAPRKIEPHVEDEKTMIRLEHHVTLDGALEFLSQLVKSVFAIDLIRDDTVQTWASEGRLYHVFDMENDNQHLGSFFLDPFKRNGKTDRPCVVPIYSRGGINGSAVPVVAMLLQMEMPPWDSDPPVMTWTDLKHLFHEMGHVLQDLLAKSPYGTLLGPHYMPRDALEILPYFMEQWLLERTTLYGLIATSDVNMEFTEESIDAFYRVVSRNKALELSQQVYLGTLELTLFSSDYDLRGKETIMALQQRLGKELAPHDNVVPPASSSDLTPLVQVLLPNVTDDPLSFYCYVWADAMSATIFARIKESYNAEKQQQQGEQTMNQNGNSESTAERGKKHHSKFLSIGAIRRLLLHPGAVIPTDEIRKEWALEDNVAVTTQLLARYGLIKKQS